MIRLLSVVGARPNFMKIAPVIKELNMRGWRIFPTSNPLSCIPGSTTTNFFPAVFLGSGPASTGRESWSWFRRQAAQTAEIMKGIEPVPRDYGPDMILVVSDVNSTIAAALTAVKLGIRWRTSKRGCAVSPNHAWGGQPPAHGRDFYVAFCERAECGREPKTPRHSEEVFLVGNVMIDCPLRHRELARRSAILDRLGMPRNRTACPACRVLALHRLRTWIIRRRSKTFQRG